MSDIQGMPNASGAPQPNIRSTGEADDHEVNFNKNKRRQSLVRSNSENDLFFERYLAARPIFALPSKDDANMDEKIDSPENLLRQINDFSISGENKKYISKNVSKMIQAKAKVNSNISNSADKQPSLNSIQQKDMDWCKNANIPKITAEMLKLAKLGFDLRFLEDCSLRQQAVIVGYVSQMLDYGYSVEYSKVLFDSMITLYTFKDEKGFTLEKYLPSSIKEKDYKRILNQLGDDGEVVLDDDGNVRKRSILTYGNSYDKCREHIVDFLKEAMDKLGADYGIISRYFKEQQRGSWNELPKIFKGFFLLQRENLSKDRYYFLPGKKTENGKYVFGPKSYINNVYEQLRRKNITYEQLFKTISMYQAFVAVAMYYIENIKGLDKDNGMLKLYRVSQNKHIPGQPQGILESTCLEKPLAAEDGEKIAEKSPNSIILKVPLCDIKFVYFLSQEMCQHEKYAEQREILCDLTNATIEDCTQIDLKKLGDPEIIDVGKDGEIVIRMKGVPPNVTDSNAYYVARLKLEEDEENGNTVKSYIEVALIEDEYDYNKYNFVEVVHLYDKYGFWDDHIIFDKEYKGYTDDPRIIEIAKKAEKRDEIFFVKLMDIDESEIPHLNVNGFGFSIQPYTVKDKNKKYVHENGNAKYVLLERDGHAQESKGEKVYSGRAHDVTEGFNIEEGGYTDDPKVVEIAEKVEKGNEILSIKLEGIDEILEKIKEGNKIPSMKSRCMDEDDRVWLIVNGIKSYIDFPYLESIPSNKRGKYVYLRSENNYWEQHIQKGGNVFNGWTDDPKIVKIAEIFKALIESDKIAINSVDVTDVDDEGKLSLKVNGIRSYIEFPYFYTEQKKNYVKLMDEKGFWNKHTNVRVQGKKHSGCTDDTHIVSIAKNAKEMRERINKSKKGQFSKKSDNCKIFFVKTIGFDSSSGKLYLSINGLKSYVDMVGLLEKSADEIKYVQLHEYKEGEDQSVDFWSKNIFFKRSIPEEKRSEKFAGCTDDKNILDKVKDALKNLASGSHSDAEPQGVSGHVGSDNSSESDEDSSSASAEIILEKEKKKPSGQKVEFDVKTSQGGEEKNQSLKTGFGSNESIFSSAPTSPEDSD